MKKKIKINKIFFLIMFLIMIPISCNGGNINMMDRERLLKKRIQEFCNLIEEGKFKQTRNYYIPQLQNKPEQEYKGDLSSIPETPETKDTFDYYKIKDIKFRDEIAEILIDFSKLNKKHTTYDYWIFVKDNWYIVDYGRSIPSSADEIKEYKKLVQDNSK